MVSKRVTRRAENIFLTEDMADKNRVAEELKKIVENCEIQESFEGKF